MKDGEEQKFSLIQKLLDRQKGKKVKLPKKSDKIGFSLASKDRSDLTLQTLRGIDQEKGFDFIWIDGSDTKEGKDLQKKFSPRHANLIEKYSDIHTGSIGAIVFGLKRLLELDYEYCGLIENDVVLRPKWFSTLMNTFNYAAKDGIVVGATTVRSYKTRVLEYRKNYTINWSMGGGMILFTREAADLVVKANEKNLRSISLYPKEIVKFYSETFDVDISSMEEWKNRISTLLFPPSQDWSWSTLFYKHGLASIGSIPNMAKDIGLYDEDRAAQVILRSYVTNAENNKGMNYPQASGLSRAKLRLVELTTGLVPSTKLYKYYDAYSMKLRKKWEEDYYKDDKN
jgi:hypothetical protein